MRESTQTPGPSLRLGRLAGVYFLFWTLVGLAFAGQHYLTSAKIGRASNWAVSITGALADWYVFAVLAIPAIWLARRFNFGGHLWQTRVALHVLASGVFSLLWILARAAFAQVLVPLRGVEMPFNELLRYVLVATFFFNMLVYWVVVTGAHAFDYYRSLRERELRLVEMERRLTTARLHALQMQLNPHFLFNALNGIGTLMYRDVDAADAMLVKLATLLRHVLDQGSGQRTSLRDELSFLDGYLELEKMRFADRLQVIHEVDPEVGEALVPSLILQPLVENAIKHGIEPLTRPGRITIRARAGDEGRLKLEVEDNGRGLDSGGSGKAGFGIGTTNTRARLTQLYGARGQFELLRGGEGGVLAVVEIPLDIPASSQQFAPRGHTDARPDSR